MSEKHIEKSFIAIAKEAVVASLLLETIFTKKQNKRKIKRLINAIKYFEQLETLEKELKA